MLIDEWLPECHARERHEMVICARAMEIYTALRTVDFGRSLIVRVLLGVRAMPTLLDRSPRVVREIRRQISTPSLTLDRMFEHGLTLLDEAPGKEVVIGLVGRFWTASGGLLTTSATKFRQPSPLGTAKVAWNFSLEEFMPGKTRVATETRIYCADQASRRAFRCYWLLVRPFSGVLRRVMLHMLWKAVE